MIEITNDYREKVVAAMLEARANYSGTDTAFSKKMGINASVYNRIKNGERGGLLRDAQWLNLGRELGVEMKDRKWNTARTDVFTVIEEDILFCKAHSKAKICVDDCGIGKTYTAKYLSRTLKNCFYIDASQCKGKYTFIRHLAKVIGVDDSGRISDVKAGIKYYLKQLPNPVVIIDEAGDLEYASMLDLKELWNATENCCGWYMMGADGLRKKIDRGITSKKVGYRELFSRYSDRYTTVVPAGRQDKIAFYRKLITDVLSVNIEGGNELNEIVKKCLIADTDGNISGLRRAESLLILNNE